MPVLITDNEATAARRRVPLLIYADTAGAAWAGSVTGVKAQLSLNGATEVASTADIVRVNGAWHYVELTQAETNRTPGDRLLVRVASAAGRLEASSVVEITADDAYAAAPTDASIATAVWANGTRTLSSFGTLVADTATAVWNAVTRTLTSAGAGGATAAEVWAFATRTLTSGGGGTAPTAAENATATRNALLADFDAIPTAGEVAAAVNAPSASTIAAAVAAPTASAIAAAVAAPTSGAIATAVRGALAPDFAAIPVPPTTAATTTAVLNGLAGVDGVPAREAIADTWLNRAIQGGTNIGRKVKEALYFLRNRVVRNVATGVVTVYEPDDSTTAWTTQTATSTSAAPVISSDPA
jgi:hypothetical protein